MNLRDTTHIRHKLKILSYIYTRLKKKKYQFKFLNFINILIYTLSYVSFLDKHHVIKFVILPIKSIQFYKTSQI